MHEYLHVLVESLLDTVKILPILFVVYYLIELLEYKETKKIANHKLFKGKASPVMGAVIGSVPQCGFSVVSTDLFSKGKLSVGALIAVYIATSDEALPIMISQPKSIGWMLLLIVIKILFAILVGFLSILLYGLIFKKKALETNEEHDHEHEEHEDEEEEEFHGGCCHHHVETKSFDWLHPLLHCLKISAFILGINLIFGMITHIWVGEENLIKSYIFVKISCACEIHKARDFLLKSYLAFFAVFKLRFASLYALRSSLIFTLPTIQSA